MMKVLAAFFLIAFARPAVADVLIESFFQRALINQRSYTVSPGKWLALDLNAGAGGKIQVQARIKNKRFQGGRILVCGPNDFDRFRAGHTNNCVVESTRGQNLRLVANIRKAGRYYLVLDNRQSTFIQKRFRVTVEVPDVLSEQVSAQLRNALEQLDALVIQSFKDAAFDFTIQGCGNANAHSDIRTGNITLCTELLQAVARRQSHGELMGILMHELVHSILNFWGMPSYVNEEAADAFATYMLLESGNRGVVEEFAASWERHDSEREAEAIIKYGDTHPLSVQRARNIRRNARNAKTFTKRWQNIVYPRFTNTMLREIVNAPKQYSAPYFALKLLRERGVEP